MLSLLTTLESATAYQILTAEQNILCIILTFPSIKLHLACSQLQQNSLWPLGVRGCYILGQVLTNVVVL